MAKKSNSKLKAEFRVSLERTKNMTEEEVEREFEKALQDARATARKYNITQEDIDAEIRAVRSEKKSKREESDLLSGYFVFSYDHQTSHFKRNRFPSPRGRGARGEVHDKAAN
jgi:hypothetical protein